MMRSNTYGLSKSLVLTWTKLALPIVEAIKGKGDPKRYYRDVLQNINPSKSEDDPRL